MKYLFKQLNFASLFFLVIFLVSCTLSMPHAKKMENILPPPSLECSVAKSLETPFFSLGPWPDPNWWQMFQMEDLDFLIQSALALNPDIKVMQARLNFAEQEAVIAHARLLPLVTFDGQVAWSHLSENGLYKALNPRLPLDVKLIDLTLNFCYEFDFWGKNRNLFMALLGIERARLAELADMRLITTTALAEAYFALKTSYIKKELYLDLLKVRGNAFRLQDRLRKSALVSRLPALLYEEDYIEAEQWVEEIEAEIAFNYHRINILSGRGPDFPIEISPLLPPVPEQLIIPQNLSLDLLARRPDLMAQIWRAESAAKEVGARMANFYPDFNLTSFLGLESVSFSRLFKASSVTYGATPAIHLPIFTAGALTANLRGAKALFDESVFEYDSLLLRAAKEVADLLALAKSIYARKIEQENNVAAAEERYHLVQLRRKSGLDSLFDDYMLEEEVIFKKLYDVELLYHEYGAVIKLIKALGGGYAEMRPCI